MYQHCAREACPSNVISLCFVADCPSLLCEELGDEEKKDERGCVRGAEVEEKLVKHSKDEGIGTEQEEGEPDRVHEAEQVKLKASEAEGETWTLQMNKCDRHRGAKKDKRRRRKNAEERDERRRGRTKRSKKRIDNDWKRRNRKASPAEQFEENSTSEAQEVVVEEEEGEERQEAAAVSESPSKDSCDLPEPIFIGFEVAGQCGSALPGPLLCSSQSLVPIQPGPPPASAPLTPPPAGALAPQFHGTKRRHSPVLPRGLPQPPPQPVEVRPGHERQWLQPLVSTSHYVDNAVRNKVLSIA